MEVRRTAKLHSAHPQFDIICVVKNAATAVVRSFRLSLLLGCLTVAFGLNAETLKGKVVKVADGDTITVLDSTNGQNKVRFFGIDAPEKKQAFGEASRKHLASFVAGKDVRVEWTSRDKYNRILGRVYVKVVDPESKEAKEIDTNYRMVKDGFAWHYKHFCKDEQLAEAEKDAKAKGLGLWKDKNPVAPWDFRKNKSVDK